MAINILMPALSPTMEKGNLSRWLKKEGDQVKAGDVIAEIETDKATMEIESADEGVLAKIVVPEGAIDVPINEVIGVISEEGASSEQGASANAPSKTQGPAETRSGAATSGGPRLAAGASAGDGSTAKTKEAAGPPARLETHRNGARIFASPLARRIAKLSDIDLSKISGSGPHGRIVERDVKAALAKAPAPPSAAVEELKPPLAPPSDELVKKYFEPGSYEEIPHDSMRKAIARRLGEASRTIPHFHLSADCGLDALLALREAINAAAPKDKDGGGAFKISVNDFIIKALALALIRVPNANVTWTEAALLKHKRADVGVAVSIPGGLITPVIRAAEIKTLSTISNEIKDLAARARLRKLKPMEYEGGSTAITNLGMMGIKSFSAIINPPHASILAVGAAEPRAVVKDGQLAVATLMSVTLSIDHRAIDGALGAELLGAFKNLIENPAGMLV